MVVGKYCVGAGYVSESVRVKFNIQDETRQKIGNVLCTGKLRVLAYHTLIAKHVRHQVVFKYGPPGGVKTK